MVRAKNSAPFPIRYWASPIPNKRGQIRPIPLPPLDREGMRAGRRRRAAIE